MPAPDGFPEWPAVDEAVHLEPYSQEWPRQFVLEMHRITNALGISNANVEHTGSTAVPGLLSKPIVDMMLGLGDYPPAQSIIDTIVALGYEDCGEASVPQRRYFRRRAGVDFNLHAVIKGGVHWTTNIALRDYLRSAEYARARYTVAKQSAIAAGATMLLSYSAAKASVVCTLIEEALRTQKNTGA